MSKLIEVTFGDRRIAVDPDRVTVKVVKQLYKALNDVKKAHNPLIKYPRLVNEEGTEESYEAWRDRVLNDYADQLNKKDDEDESEYDSRLVSLALADSELQIAFEFINKVCEILNLPALSEDQFECASADKICAFCFDLLAVGRIVDSDYLFQPSRRTKDLIGK